MVLLALLLAQAPVASPGGPVFSMPSRMSQLAFFEFAPASGAGMGTACACTTPTGSKGEALTFTRASVAECYSNDGQSLTQCTNNQPRVSSGSATSARPALWKEKQSINQLLHSRNLSNAAWTKTNMTCTLTATGMRGGANTASTCTATAGNGTATQTVAWVSGLRNGSLNLKRVTGTGTVETTLDGVTWYPVNASLSTTLWRRVVPWSTPGCAGGNCIIVSGMSATVTNPTIGIRLGTSGDVVEVDFTQLEDGWQATSPIESTVVAATRTLETAYFVVASGPIRSLRAAILSNGYNGQFVAPVFAWQDGSNAFTVWNPSVADVNQNFGCLNLRTTLNQASGFSYLPTSSESFTTMTCDVTDSTSIRWTQRGVDNSAVTASTAVPNVTRIYLAGAELTGYGAPYDMNTLVRDVCADPTTGRCSPTFDSTGSPLAAVGDSLTYGLNQSPRRWVYTLGQALNRPVYNIGFTGATVAQCTTSYTNYVSGKGFAGVTVLCGVNDLAAGTTDAVIYSALSALFDSIIASGARLTIGTILPWSGFVSWDATKQTRTTNLNTSILGYCSAHPGQATCVDFYNSALRTGTALAAGVDSGDGIHVNAAGADIMAGLWQAAAP